MIRLSKTYKYFLDIYDFYLNKTWARVLLWMIVLIFWFSLIYVLNVYTYFTSDDFRYHFIYQSYLPLEENTRINEVSQIIPSMVNHYNMWGGRIPAHTLVQFFLMLGKPIFNFINTLGYLSLGALVYYHSKSKENHSLLLFNLILLLMWFFIPEFGLSILWVSGSGNYLWNTIIILLFLLPYRNYAFNNNNIVNNKVSSLIFSILMLTMGVIAGWTNENTSGAMICLTIFFIIYYKLNKKMIPIWSIIGLIGAFIGFILLIKAPGNYLRPQMYGAATESVSLIIYIKVSIIFLMNCIDEIGFLILFYGMLIVWKSYFSKKNNKINIISLCYAIASALAMGAMILSPERPLRTLFGTVIFMIIAIGYLFSHLVNIKCFRNRMLFLVIIGFGLFISSYLPALLDIKNTHEFIMNEHVEVIKEQKNLGNMNITIKQIPTPESTYNAFNGSANLQLNSDAWFNQWLAEYFGVDTIEGVKE